MGFLYVLSRMMLSEAIQALLDVACILTVVAIS